MESAAGGQDAASAGAPFPAAGSVDWGQVRQALDRASGTWVVPVLRHLAMGTSRPLDLLQAVNREAREDGGGRALSRKVLFETLRRLQNDGLVGNRSAHDTVPPVAAYWLTPGGHALLTRVSRLGEPPAPRPAAARPADPAGAPPYAPAPGTGTSLPSPARIWNWALGGKNHFAADREAGAAVLDAMPSLAHTACLTRLFQADAVRRLVAAGFRQFLDIGTGLPVAGSVHEVAQREAPESRVVYVDNDPLVLAYARSLLAGSPEGRCAYLHADLRDPGRIMARAAQTLDLREPVAVLAIMVLHFIPDEDGPREIVGELLRGIGGAAALVVGHAAAEHSAESSASAAQEYNARSPVPVRLRHHDEVAGFFDGLELLPPGLVSLAEWLPSEAAGLTDVNGHVGVGVRALPAAARARLAGPVSRRAPGAAPRRLPAPRRRAAEVHSEVTG